METPHNPVWPPACLVFFLWTELCEGGGGGVSAACTWAWGSHGSPSSLDWPGERGMQEVLTSWLRLFPELRKQQEKLNRNSLMHDCIRWYSKLDLYA